MSAYRRIFIDRDNFSSFLTSPTNVNVIILKNLLFMKSHTGGTLGLQTLSLGGVDYPEVSYSTYDTLGNENKHTVNPTTNELMILVAKTVDTEEKARELAIGFLLVYQMANIAYSGTDNYQMKVFTADGFFVGETTGKTLSDLSEKILVYDSGIEINSAPGFYTYQINKNIIPQ